MDVVSVPVQLAALCIPQYQHGRGRRGGNVNLFLTLVDQDKVYGSSPSVSSIMRFKKGAKASRAFAAAV